MINHSRFNLKVLSPSDYQIVPWKNGQGTTEEIYRYQEEATEEFSWRISIATIAASGPFSTFPGVDRVLIPLSGGELSLSLDSDAPIKLSSLTPFVFQGETPISCTLVGSSARDFNVMARRSDYRAEVEVVDLKAAQDYLVSPGEGNWSVIYVVSGSVQCSGALHASLQPRQTLIARDLQEAVQLHLTSSTTLILSRLFKR